MESCEVVRGAVCPGPFQGLSPSASLKSIRDMKKIAFLGASVTQQTRARETGEMTGYVEAFRENHSAGLGFEEVIALAYPGNRLTDAGLILAQQVLEQKPDVVILELTVEDRSRGCDFDERHLIYLTQMFISNEILPVFFAMPKPDRDDPNEDFVSELIRCFAEGADLLFCAPHLPPGSLRSDYYRDGIHTNIEGALYYADGLAKFLQEFAGKGMGKKQFGFPIRRLTEFLRSIMGYGNLFRKHAKPTDLGIHVMSVKTPKSGDFKTIVIRNHAPKQAGGTIRIIQNQEIGRHSPVIDVEVLTTSGDWRTHQTSIWDPYCHYTRHSYVTLVKVDGHDFKTIRITVASTLPNYADCRREHDNTLAQASLCMRSDQPFWVISDSAVNLSINIKRR